MSVISAFIDIRTYITDMKYHEVPLISTNRLSEAADLGAKLTRLRTARKLRQLDVAARAGLSRSTAALIEKGDPGRTVAQILRYLEAIAPGLPLVALLLESDPSLKALEQLETTQRVRPLSTTELQQLDF
jgi:transcriptional regulator with XRE-family HTH domain